MSNNTANIQKIKEIKKKIKISDYIKVIWIITIFIGIIEKLIPNRDRKPRRTIVKYQNLSKYDVTNNQVKINQRLTDRAIRSLHSVCRSVNTEYRNYNLVLGLILMSFLLSGQSGGEQSLGSPQERYPTATRDDLPHHGEGDCYSGWPADDLPGFRVSRFESKEKNTSDIMKFVTTIKVIVNKESYEPKLVNRGRECIVFLSDRSQRQ